MVFPSISQFTVLRSFFSLKVHSFSVLLILYPIPNLSFLFFPFKFNKTTCLLEYCHLKRVCLISANVLVPFFFF